MRPILLSTRPNATAAPVYIPSNIHYPTGICPSDISTQSDYKIRKRKSENTETEEPHPILGHARVAKANVEKEKT